MLAIFANPPHDNSIDEHICHLLQIIFPRLPAPDKTMFINALIKRLEDDNLDTFMNVLRTLKSILVHSNTVSQKAIIEALHPQLKPDEAGYSLIGKVYLNILGQTNTISEELAVLETKLTRSSPLVAELLPKVFPELQGPQCTLKNTK